MNTMQGYAAALRLGGATIYPLLALAFAAAVVIVDKAFLLAARARLPSAARNAIDRPDAAWDEIEGQVASLGRLNYFARFLRVILEQRKRPAWWVESRAAEAASAIEQSLGRWLWTLETIVTAAPLLGLLGTITGMIRAFRLFGSEGLVDPRGVTGGVAEALIATAVGLFVALIALFAFNYFSHRQAQVLDEMERIGTRLIDLIRIEEHGGMP